MEILLTILTTLSVLGLVYLYWKNVIRRVATENTMQILDIVAKNLALQALDNKNTLNELMAKDANIQALIQSNEIIFNKNEKTLKATALELFHIKECVLWLWVHYNSMLTLIDANATTGAIDIDKVQTVRMNIVQSMMIVESYFINTFHVHPSDYQKSKQTIMGPNGNSIGDFSVN